MSIINKKTLPVIETIGSQAKSRFTGTIQRVTVEVQPMKTADKIKEDRMKRETIHKMEKRVSIVQENQF